MSSPSTDLTVSRIHFCTSCVSSRALVLALKQSMPPSLTFATSRSCFPSCFFPPAGCSFRKMGPPESPKQTLLGSDQVAQSSSNTLSSLEVLNRREPSQPSSSTTAVG